MGVQGSPPKEKKSNEEQRTIETNRKRGKTGVGRRWGTGDRERRLRVGGEPE